MVKITITHDILERIVKYWAAENITFKGARMATIDYGQYLVTKVELNGVGTFSLAQFEYLNEDLQRLIKAGWPDMMAYNFRCNLTSGIVSLDVKTYV
jgi:hypothetical protein